VDSQVKQRITGAVVLVALIVVFVPALLTGPRHAGSGPAPAPSLPGEPALQSYRSDLKAAPTQVAPPASDTPQAKVDDAVTAVTAGEAVDTAPAAQETPRSIPPKPTPAPASARPAAAAPKAASATPSPVPKKPPAATGGWVVQLGGFSSRANAEKLLADLKHQGFAAFVSEAQVSGKPLFRVRAGPMKDRPEAEALLKRLKVAGHSGSVAANP
jgi:DedD protein